MYSGRKFFIYRHDDSRFGRKWAIAENSKHGIKWFDIYFTEQEAKTAAKFYGLELDETEE